MDTDIAIDFPEAKQIISEYTHIEREFYYDIYTTRQSYLYGFTPWSGEGYNGLWDFFISESDFNLLNQALGWDTVDLHGRFLILTDMQQMMNMDFSTAEL